MAGSALDAVVVNSLDVCRADTIKSEHWLKVSVRREPPFMVFEVEDNGIGMDRETRQKVFSLFFSSKGIKGTGLGLFISNKIVDKHGGNIVVQSEPDVGTKFIIRFPLKPKPSVPPADAGPLGPRPAGRARGLRSGNCATDTIGARAATESLLAQIPCKSGESRQIRQVKRT